MTTTFVTYQNLLGETVTVKPRGRHYTEPRGYADKPGTGPKDETCGSCKHIEHGRRWAKCALTRACHTGGRRTDILVKAEACSKWEAA